MLRLFLFRALILPIPCACTFNRVLTAFTAAQTLLYITVVVTVMPNAAYLLLHCLHQFYFFLFKFLVKFFEFSKHNVRKKLKSIFNLIFKFIYYNLFLIFSYFCQLSFNGLFTLLISSLLCCDCSA